jgi:predicted negative regulator of RcsB-dependent stress response
MRAWLRLNGVAVIAFVLLGLGAIVTWNWNRDRIRDLADAVCENRLGVRAVLDGALRARELSGDPNVEIFRAEYERLKAEFFPLHEC